MTESNDRIEQFEADIAAMNVKAPPKTPSSRDPVLAWIGAVVMLGGLGLTVAAYFLSHNSTDPLEQNDYQILGVIGLTLAVIGAVVYLRASVVNFMRFWLARFIIEQRTKDNGDEPRH